MGPLDPKGHIILSDLNIDMLAVSLSMKRKHTAESDIVKDRHEVAEFLEVIRSHDCMVVSQGGIENLLNQVRDFLMDMAKAHISQPPPEKT